MSEDKPTIIPQQQEVITTETRPNPAPRNYFVKIGKLNVYRYEKLPNFIKEPLRNRYQKFYQKKRFYLITDILLVFVILESLIVTTHLLTNENSYFSFNLWRIPIFSFEKRTPEKNEQLPSPSTVKVTSKIVFEFLAKYYTAEGDQLGFGPLPPQVNQTTSYWLFWKIRSGSNDLKNIIINGTLPDNVSFNGKTSVTSGQGLEFNPLTRVISWKIDELTRQDLAQAGFEVEITPLPSQVNTSPILLNKIIIEALDSYTDQKIQKSSGDLTTALNDLGKNENLSKVIE
jgi:hypothetical protein